MAKSVITGNLSKVSARYKRIAKAMPQAVERGFERLADEAIVLRYKTTRTWKKEHPRFYWKRTAHGVSIMTDSQIYARVDFGTRGPYKIPKVPKTDADKKPFLVFKGPYRAATKPRVIGSVNASRGGFWTRKRQVTHPGIKARNFTDEIARRVQKRAANVMRAELDKAINREAVGL